VVEILNDLGDSDTFNETAPRIYQNTSFDFRGEVGRSYWIKIKTVEGNEYELEPEIMTAPVEITDMYGEEFSKFIDKDTKTESVKLYFDAKDETNETSFLRWEALESWEWRCPFKVNLVDSLLFSTEPASICFPTNKITSLNLFDPSSLGDKVMIKLPITFSTEEKQNLLYDYYIKVLVRSISFKNYHFGNHIKEVNQTSGNLFDRTPGNVVGNVYSIDGEHSVVGYFEVSSISSQTASFNESMFNVKFEIFPHECYERSQARVVPDPQRFYVTRTGFANGDTIYYQRLKECYDCTVTYSPNKPSFWQ